MKKQSKAGDPGLKKRLRKQDSEVNYKDDEESNWQPSPSERRQQLQQSSNSA